jgi:hypothetical protein
VSDPWGVISASIWRSKKFRPLNPIDRLIYLYAHTSPHRNQLGLYRLPIVFVADDLDLPPDQCRQSLDNLATAQLIDYDPDEALIRIRNWELKNAVSGPQEAIGRITSAFDESPDHVFTRAAFLVFACDILNRALGTAKGGDGWKKSDVRAKMEDMIFHRLINQWQADEAQMIAAFHLSGVNAADRVFDSLWHRVSDTQTIPYALGMAYTEHKHRLRTQTQTQNTEHRSRNTEHGTLNVALSASEALDAPPALPADGGRSARTIPDDVAATIASLGKAKGMQ